VIRCPENRGNSKVAAAEDIQETEQVLGAADWGTVGAVAGAITAVLGAIAAIAGYASKLLPRAKRHERAGDQGEEARSELPRPPTYAFPMPEAAVEDVLEGVVDAVNLAGYAFTLGQDDLSVATSTAERQWGGYYDLSGLSRTSGTG
jgi:hypothetical protein